MNSINNEINNEINIVLCSGRHSFPENIDNYVFSNAISDPTDIASINKTARESLTEILRKEGRTSLECPFSRSCSDCGEFCWHCSESTEYINYGTEINLYVTGLTVALIEVLNVCADLEISVTLYHYDRDSGNYFPQKVR